MSLHRRRVGSHFYGTKYEIWADFGPVGYTEKTIWADYEQLLRFEVFRGKKYCIVRTKKLHKMKVRKPKKNL